MPNCLENQSLASASYSVPFAGCALAFLLGISVLFRYDGMSNLPGVNGDEAWMGVQAEALLHGESVEFTTPTGNVLNPFHFVPQVLLHVFWQPSISLLRTTALVSSLLAIGLNFWLAMRLFDWRVATVSSALLAVLPVNIAYARFGWDASQSVLFTLPVVYLPLLAVLESKWRCWALSVAALASAVLVHPTNIFVAPMLIVPAAITFWKRNRNDLIADKRFQCVAIVATIVIGALVAVTARAWVVIAATRAVDVSQWNEFSVLYLDFLSGTTIFRFICGEDSISGFSIGTSRLAVLVAVSVAAVGYWQQWKKAAPPRQVSLGGLLAGYLLTLTGFFLVAGPDAIQPHYERYGMCLIAGALLLTAIGLGNWLFVPEARWSTALRWSALGLAALWLVFFHFHYFATIHATGGQSHLAFRTGSIEPKQAALQDIVASSDANTPIVIVSSQWWNYWPLKYLAYRYPHVDVVGMNAHKSDLVGLAASASSEQVWFVEFYDQSGNRTVKLQLEESGYMVEQRLFTDFAGVPIVEASRGRIGP